MGGLPCGFRSLALVYLIDMLPHILSTKIFAGLLVLVTGLFPALSTSWAGTPTALGQKSFYARPVAASLIAGGDISHNRLADGSIGTDFVSGSTGSILSREAISRAKISLRLPFSNKSSWRSWQGSLESTMPLEVKGKVALFGVRQRKFLYQTGDTWFIYGMPGKTLLSQKKYGQYYPQWEGRHDGIDFVAVPDQPVVAAAPGKVFFVGNYLGGTVMIDHGSGLTTTYGYLSKIKVKPGFTVKQGQEIGRITDPLLGPGFAGHLHFSLDKIIDRPDNNALGKTKGIALNPLRFLDIEQAIVPISEANQFVMNQRKAKEQPDFSWSI